MPPGALQISSARLSQQALAPQAECASSCSLREEHLQHPNRPPGQPGEHPSSGGGKHSSWLPKIQAFLFLCFQCSRFTCIRWPRQPACPSSSTDFFHKQSEPLHGDDTLQATLGLHQLGVCFARWPTTLPWQIGPSKALKLISLSPGGPCSPRPPQPLRSLWKCTVTFCLQCFPGIPLPGLPNSYGVFRPRLT